MVKRSPDLRSQLGSLLTRTFQQLEEVREVVTARAKQGRVQIDLALLRRKRKDALAALGEVVLRLAREDRLSDEDFPELAEPLAELQDLEDRLARAHTDAEVGEVDDYSGAPAPGRRRGGWPARQASDLDDDDREEYDDDDDRPARREFDEDEKVAAAGRRLRGEIDYDQVSDVDDDADEDHEVEDEDDRPPR